ncbi:neuromedin U [Thermodesulfobacteriota bacterium]
MVFRIVLGALFMLFAATCAYAESGGDDLRAKAQNPVSSMYSLPLKLTLDFGAPDDEAVFFNINPVLPVTVGDWNLVSRFIIPAIVSVDGFIEGTPDIPSGSPAVDRETGLGDINYSLYFSPADAKGMIWGIGPSITLPTANKDQLGSGKWSGGAAGVVLMQPKWGTYGGLIRQLWSFAGDDHRADVNQFLIEPFLNYNLDGGWYLITDMIITANWDAPSSERWTVPIGGGVGKLFTIGKQAINSRLEAYYMIERPDNAPDWQVIFTWQFLFPKK